MFLTWDLNLELSYLRYDTVWSMSLAVKKPLWEAATRRLYLKFPGCQSKKTITSHSTTNDSDHPWKNELRHVLLSCSELRLYSAKALGKYSKIRKHCQYLRFICLNTAFSNTQIDHETKENRWETFQKFSLKMKMKRKFRFPWIPLLSFSSTSFVHVLSLTYPIVLNIISFIMQVSKHW